MTQVAVSTELIRWAVDRAGLTQESLTKRFPKLAQWERGETHPTIRQLEKLARATTTPFGYFFLPKPPEEVLPIPDFRTVSGKPAQHPSPNLLETVQIMQRRQDWMRDYLIDQGADPLPYVGRFTPETKTQTVARDILQSLELTENWAAGHATWSDALRGLRAAAEQAGILVMANSIVGNNTHRKLAVEEFRGFVLCDAYVPLVFINTGDAKAAQMFTLAHELAHLWIGRSGVFNLEAMQPANNDVEQYCNRIAAELLMPDAALRCCWEEVRREEDPFGVLARRFKVSPLVTARRVLDLGLMTRADFFAFYEEYQADDRRKKHKSDGGDFYATQGTRIGRRFAEAVIIAARQGRLLYRDAYQLTGLHGSTFDHYAKHLGFDC